ncbi:energy-coupling factor transporter transmembrane component T [Ruminococcus sp.]|uniref:energy-coupling factor transporter transmembrane component T n=1 Tax=Ruminococcus sp. TaxID=41978 RepID=UPI00388F3A5C
MKRFEEMNPAAVAVYYLCVLAVTMFSMNPLLLAVALVTAVLSAAVSGTASGRAHLFSAAVFVIAAVLNPLFVHKGMTVLFYLNDRPVTLEAVCYGLSAAAMITAALYRLRDLSKALSSDKVLYLFGRFSPKLALLLSMAIRYVALLRQRWRRISDAQRALGLYDDGNLIDALRGRARVLSILMTWTLENGIITAESMESRGYGCTRRTSYAVYHVRYPDVLLMLVCLLLTAVTVVGVQLSRVVYYPELDLALFSPWGTAGAVAFTLLNVLPLLINLTEVIRWRSLRSKI